MIKYIKFIEKGLFFCCLLLLSFPAAPVTWESYNYPTSYICHMDSTGQLLANVSPPENRQWNMVSGLADPNGISFESVNNPGMYLRHYNYKLRLESVSDSIGYEDATFFMRDGLADSSWTSFESYTISRTTISATKTACCVSIRSPRTWRSRTPLSVRLMKI